MFALIKMSFMDKVAEANFERKVNRLTSKLIRQALNLENKNRKLNAPKVLLYKHYRERKVLGPEDLIQLRIQLSENIPKQKKIFEKLLANIHDLEVYYNQLKNRDAEKLLGDFEKNVDSAFKTGKSLIEQLIITLKKEEPVISAGKSDWVSEFMDIFLKELKIYVGLKENKQIWAKEFSDLVQRLKKMKMTPSEVSKYSHMEDLMYYFAVALCAVLVVLISFTVTIDTKSGEKAIHEYLMVLNASVTISLIALFTIVMATKGRKIAEKMDWFIKMDKALNKGI